MSKHANAAKIIFLAYFFYLCPLLWGEKINSDEKTPGVYRIESLTASEINTLDRNKTMCILPLGMLEEHGPHLPIGTDTYSIYKIINGMTHILLKNYAGWTILIFPAVNFEEGGANGLSGNPIHHGTYEIRHTTIRSILVDIGAQVAANSFRWLFVMSGHYGTINNNLAINDACDFINDNYEITMVNLLAIHLADSTKARALTKMMSKYYSPAEIRQIGFDLHAGTQETSLMLAIYPERVKSIYKDLPDQTGADFREVVKTAKQAGWLGFLGSPRLAKRSYGKEYFQFLVNDLANLISRAIQGEDLKKLPRYPEGYFSTAFKMPVHEKALSDKLDQWLKLHGKQ